MPNKKSFQLNDLPQFSPWPARLLGVDPYPQRHKTPSNVTREFEDEKWAPLLRKVRSLRAPVTIKTADQLFFGENPNLILGLFQGKFTTWSMAQQHRRYLDLIEKTLKPFLPAAGIVELGCGYGSIILNLAQRKSMAKIPLWAADYVPSGVALTREIAENQGTKIKTGLCDLSSAKITDLKIPVGAVIYTSYAVMYIPQLRTQFVKAIAKFKPKAVIHFEPCFEDADTSTLFGLMKKRYIQINDYNINLISILRSQQRAGKIKILMEKADVFGGNALLPASMIIWEPRKR